MPKKTNKTKYTGDCSPKGIIKRATEVYKMSNAKNPAKTGNKTVDFNLGKIGFVAKQTYNDTCKRKK